MYRELYMYVFMLCAMAKQRIINCHVDIEIDVGIIYVCMYFFNMYLYVYK